MSTQQCNRFVQNAWKKELCSNCFKPREEHASVEETFRLNIGKALTHIRADNLKLQSILRARTVCQKDQKKKNVAFPECLTEVIGYGGDDFLSDCEDDEDDQRSYVDSLNGEDDGLPPDSEEERALCNLTRANTNFNTITANLTEPVATAEPSKSAKSFASLMLGRMQKDSEGRKTTLLVSVTPFGGDESLPTAKRPTDRKITVNGFAAPVKCKVNEAPLDSKPEILLKSVKKIEPEPKKPDKPDPKFSPGLEKIVDMPLIASNNLIPVIHRNDSAEADSIPADRSTEVAHRTIELGKAERKIAVIARSPAIKKPDNEKPRIAVQQPVNGHRIIEYESVVARTVTVKRSTEIIRTETDDVSPPDKMDRDAGKNDEDSLAESERSIRSVGSRELANKNGTAIAENGNAAENEDADSHPGVVVLLGEKKFSCEESRELAGEPDGRADEEEMTEPPALPRSPPPMEARPPVQGEVSSRPVIAMEPRPSFLHGAVHPEAKVKPVVPQKPMSFPKNATVGEVNTKKMANGYVPPPPSVQNANRSAQSAGPTGQVSTEQTGPARPLPKDKSEEIRTTSLEQCRPNTADVDVSVNQTPRVQQSPVKFEPLKPVSHETTTSATQPPSHKTKPSPPSLIKSQPTTEVVADSGCETLETEEETETQSVESIRSPNKRRMAPRPPEPTTTEDLPPSASLFARNPGATSLKSDSPVVREKEKRERASSCSPKFRKAVSELPDPTSTVQPADPRRTISLSQDSLTTGQEVREEKKRGRSRFSLKRFLRMGSRKDVDMISGHGSGTRGIDEIPSTPQPKPRLEIIHPLELDGAAVEVVGNDRVGRISEDQTDSVPCPRNDASRASRSPLSARAQHAAVRPGKPPPPPRNQSLEDWSRLDPASKPVRPPPPRVETKQLPLRTDKSSSKSSSSSSSTSSSSSSSSTTSWQPAPATTTSDSIYANLAAEDVTGEVRSSLAPSKPQRTASMRDQCTSQPVLKKHPAPTASVQALNQDYETVALVPQPPPTSDSPTSNDSHVYECLSSSPECDSNLELRHGTGSHLACKRKSDSGPMEPVEFKFHHQPFVRSTSLPYCGSETESELYAPYSFYAGDEGPEEDQDWKNKDDELRISRLRQRRGRSIVHRSLEDNYGAVVVANHEALAQFLEQLNQVPQVPIGLRGLKNGNPRIGQFNVDANAPITIGRRIFYSATWNEQSVTLCITLDLASHVSRKEFYLAPVIEFVDSLPRDIVERAGLPGNKDIEASISVLPRLQVSSIQSFGASARDSHDEATTREASFVLLQFVNALKSLQARGIEEAVKSLSNVVLCREDKDACYRLYLLQGLNIDASEDRTEERVSLCQCALVALQQLHLTSRLPLIQDLLMREKAVTLSQVKSVLEFSLWGPADVTLGGPREREVALQRWLDLERATVLHALVRTRSPLTVTDEYQLLFLVRTSAKIMSEASLLLDEQRSRLSRGR